MNKRSLSISKQSSFHLTLVEPNNNNNNNNKNHTSHSNKRAQLLPHSSLLAFFHSHTQIFVNFIFLLSTLCGLLETCLLGNTIQATQTSKVQNPCIIIELSSRVVSATSKVDDCSDELHSLFQKKKMNCIQLTNR
jgi:hypothetical protein